MKSFQSYFVQSTIVGFFLISGALYSYEPQLQATSAHHNVHRIPTMHMVNHTLLLLKECHNTLTDLATRIKSNGSGWHKTSADNDSGVQSMQRVSSILTKLSTLVTYINALNTATIRFSSTDNESCRTVGQAINKVAHTISTQIATLHTVITSTQVLVENNSALTLNASIDAIAATLHRHKKALSDHIRTLEKTVGIHKSKH